MPVTLDKIGYRVGLTVGRLTRPNLVLPYRIVVGTHHKCGTVWLARILQDLAYRFRFKMQLVEQPDLDDDFQIFFQDHSRIYLDRLPSRVRGVHLIRDPRDAIVSGCLYHQKSQEPWLHQRHSRFGGMSYAERIKSFKSPEARLMFEMEQAGQWLVNDLLAWDYAQPQFLELRYEDLIQDYDLALFSEMFGFLGFPAKVLPELKRIAFNNSLFSGRVKKAGHVRSGRSGQWREHFRPRHCQRFLELFGDALVRLGYESDDGWVSSCTSFNSR